MIAIAETAAGIPIYQLKVTLKGSKPKIWRRFLVRADMKLPRFHDVLQLVMGWTDSHLHQFIIKSNKGPIYIGIPDPDSPPSWQKELNEKRFRVADLLAAPKQKIQYEYDFGDGWEHEILLEKILPPDPSFKHPICLAGANACPPEDCGGIWGYYDPFLKALNDPKHEDHQMYKDWIGGSWDPSLLDPDDINNCLKKIKA
jgi:hypothetical protein